MGLVKLICKQCSKEFNVPYHRRETAICCSVACSSQYRTFKIDGQRFNRLIVIRDVDPEIQYSYGKPVKMRKVECLCDCGNLTIVRLTMLKNGETKSCGCLKKEFEIKNLDTSTHKMCKHPLYHIWGGMIQRCTNPKLKCFHNYGGRGVCVCKEWREDFMSFYNWAINNGWKKGLDLDKDKIGNGLLYGPDTCCFITQEENSQYKRTGVFIYYEGIKFSINQISLILNINRGTVKWRIRNGWSIDKIIKRAEDGYNKFFAYLQEARQVR